MKLTKSHLREMVNSVIREETEYQAYFKKMLDKFGKNSPADMSDEEKKKFFSAVDAGWKAKGEVKNESSGGKVEYQKFFKKMLDKYGKDSPADMSDEEKKEFFNAVDKAWKAKDESVNESVSKFDDVRIKSTNQMGMIYAIQGKKVVVKTAKGLVKTTVDDLEVMANESVNNIHEVNIGDKLKHKYTDGVSIELIEPTNKGWKVKQTGDGTPRGKNKTKTAFFDRQDISGDKALFVKESVVNEVKFYAFWNNKKHEIEADSLWAARQKAITQLKVPKSKQGLLSIVNADEHKRGSFRFESVNESSTEMKKLEDAIKIFQDKIKAQGRITNARDEEHLERLIKLYKEMGGKKIKESVNENKVDSLKTGDKITLSDGRTAKIMAIPTKDNPKYKKGEIIVTPERGRGNITINVNTDLKESKIDEDDCGCGKKMNESNLKGDAAWNFQSAFAKAFRGKNINGWKMYVDPQVGTFSWNHPKSPNTVFATPYWEGEESVPIDVIDDRSGDEFINTSKKLKYTGDFKKDMTEYLKIMNSVFRAIK